jgi:hypothetical protein
MALKLHIPALKEKPLIVADTHPQKISQSLAGLHLQHPLDIASHLFLELEILNRQKVSPNHRLQALDAYRPTLIKTVQALADDYCYAALPLHDKARIAAATAESLWLELGYGYKLALTDLQNQLIKLGTEKNSAHAIQRAMHAIAEYAMVNYQTYFPVPDHIWGDLHQLYFCAVQLGIQHNKINMDSGDFDVEDFETTIEGTYKHALLMSLADPQHLSQPDMRRVADYLAYHVKDAQISAVTPLETTSAAFIISLNANEPPIPYSKYRLAPNPTTDILLQTIDLVRLIHLDLNHLINKETPKDGRIPENFHRDTYIDLLTYLIKHWGIIPQRLFNRLKKNGELEIVTGITAIHHVLNSKPLANILIVRHADELEAQHQTVRASRWQILNISATGMSVRRHPTAEKNIRIGHVLGIKAKHEDVWSIGVVRWASCGTRDRLDMGVQLIAPSAQSAMLRLSGDSLEEAVLLLPEIPAIKQVETIMAPIGTYEPALRLTLMVNQQKKHILLTKLIERSHYFERIQFSTLNP